MLKILFTTFLLLTHLSIAAIIQAPQSQKTPSAPTKFDPSNLDKNSIVFHSFDSKYQIISQAYAIQSEPDTDLDLKNTQNSHWTKQLGHYKIIIPNKQAAPKQTELAAAANDNYAVAYNHDSQQIGVVTGDIVVKFTPFLPQLITNIAQTYGLSITAEFKHLNLVFFRVPNGANIVLINQQLNAEGAIESANIEVLETIDMPH